ncbi:MAG TPA: M28 family peptidase, partial [Planctomycetota bacterium]|nr:M28 family peptidase [Planctomycetota bacterium]
ICFRGFRDPKNPRYAQIFVVDADGSNEKQLTFDVAVNWAPFWHADGETLVYSKNVGGHRNYDLFLVKASGGPSVRISRAPEADVLPVFSPDGKKILWTSTRADGRSQLFIADFRMPTAEEWATLAAEEEARLAAEKVAAEERAKSSAPAAPAAEPIRLDAERLLADVKTLADDRLEGRRAGTEAAKLAAGMVTIAFREAGLTPADDDGDYLQKFPMLVGFESGEGGVSFRHQTPNDGFLHAFQASPSSFTSLRGTAGAAASGALAFRGYGLAVDGVSDDYAGLPPVKGRVVVLFERGVPTEALAAADPHSNPQAFFDAYPKALAAKMRGAAAVVFVRDSKQRGGDELAAPTVDGGAADVGIPCARVRREDLALVLGAFGRKLDDLEEAATATQGVGFDLPVEVVVDKRLVETRGDALNVIAAVRGRETPNEHVLITAHYDHLGWGGQGSLAEGGAAPQIHNGADDNASGTAGLIGLAQWFAKRPAKRTLVFVAFSGEEEGLLGSQHFLAHPTVPVDSIVAVVNLDMIGRYRPEEGVAIDGVATAEAFAELIAAANGGRLKVSTTAGAMSGRSDHASFIARGIPALHLFTGAHVDYHKPSDDADKIDAKGLAAVAELAGEIARRLADLPQRPVFVKPKPVSSVGGTGFGAWLGTIPSYAQDEGGVRLSGVSAGSPAEKAGLKADDVLIRLGEFPIGNIQDFTTALRSRKPGDEVEVEIVRGGAKTVFKVVLGRR